MSETDPKFQPDSQNSHISSIITAGACQVYYLSSLFLDGSQTTLSALERVNKGDSKKRRTIVYPTKQGTSEIRKF
jgi:hypothetical protein